MPHYLLSSHDGFGLGHVRRNIVIARALLDADPSASVTVVTGVRARPAWLEHARISVVAVPPLLKDASGTYRNPGMSFQAAIDARARLFSATVDAVAPDVVVVDRHPFGVAGELRRGLDRARAGGAITVLGLRDVLDQPEAVAHELSGRGWLGVGDSFDEVLVYGERCLCDHQAEYGLPIAPRYCGWVTEAPAQSLVDPDVVIVAAGGGGDGQRLFHLGIDVLRQRPGRRAILVAGPYASFLRTRVLTESPDVRARLQLWDQVPSCVGLFAQAGASVQMAGYNSTFEALAAGLRPILVPRRAPRREQAIRATRLAALGLADVVDEAVDPADVAWLLDRDRYLPGSVVAGAGIRLDGAERVARHLGALATRRAARV
ncbi:MAG: glycosyltransferase family protein [Acidimicrobiales bacterium]